VKTNLSFSPSPSFWRQFAQQHWEKKPLLIKHALPGPLIAPESAFQALVEASDQYRADDERVALGFYIEQTSLLADVGKFLPQSSDGTSARFARRIKSKLAGRRFGVICEQFQSFDTEIWRRIRGFLRGLYRHVDLPAAKAALFFGDYDKTPFGLHDGESSNFKFIIEGRKKMRLWPDKFFRDKDKSKVRHSMDYEQFFDGGITLEGGPGDVIYWPSDCWHIGEPVGGLAVSLSVALFPDGQRLAELPGQLFAHLNPGVASAPRKPTRRGRPAGLQKLAAQLPRRLEKLARSLRELSSDDEFKRDASVEWLNRLSGFGFAHVPPPLAQTKLRDGDIVRGDAADPILCLAAGDEVICSANGHAFSVGAHPEILKLLRELNRGNSLRVGALIKQYSGDARVGRVTFKARSEDIRALLEKLYCLRAIRKGALLHRRIPSNRR